MLGWISGESPTEYVAEYQAFFISFKPDIHSKYKTANPAKRRHDKTANYKKYLTVKVRLGNGQRPRQVSGTALTSYVSS